MLQQDEIIEMARQAGFSLGHNVTEEYSKKLEAFAKLVAAKEREACAKVCVELGKTFEKRMLLGFQETLGDAAKAIRARGTEA